MAKKVIQIRPDGHYAVSRGYTKADNPNEVFYKTGIKERNVSLDSDPIIRVPKKLPRYNSWEEWADDINGDHFPVPLEASNELIFTEADEHFPLSYQPAKSQKEKAAYGEAYVQHGWDTGLVDATNSDPNAKMTLYVAWAMGAGLLVMIGLIALMAFGQIDIFNRGGDPLPVVAADNTRTITDEIVEITPGRCVAYVPAIQDFQNVPCPSEVQ